MNTEDLYGATPVDRAFDMHNEMRDPQRKGVFKEIIWLLWSTRQVRDTLLKVEAAKAVPAGKSRIPSPARPTSPSADVGGGGGGDSSSRRSSVQLHVQVGVYSQEHMLKVLEKDMPDLVLAAQERNMIVMLLHLLLGDQFSGDSLTAQPSVTEEKVSPARAYGMHLLELVCNEVILPPIPPAFCLLEDPGRDATPLGPPVTCVQGTTSSVSFRFGSVASELPHLCLHLCGCTSDVTLTLQVNTDMPSGCSKRYYWLRGDMEASIRRAKTSSQVSLFHAVAFVGSGTMLLTLKELGVWDEEDFVRLMSTNTSVVFFKKGH